MPEEWEVLDRSRGPAGEGPILTIQKGGRIGLNHAAYAALGEPERVELLYAAASNRLGLRPLDKDAAGGRGYPVRKKEGARSYLISATGGLSRAGIEPADMAQRLSGFIADGMLMVNLPPRIHPGKGTGRDVSRD